MQSSSYLDMFNDAARNKAYRLAIERVAKSGLSLSLPTECRPRLSSREPLPINNAPAIGELQAAFG